jgi:hypothetical protein
MRTRRKLPGATQLPLFAAHTGWNVVISDLAAIAHRKVTPTCRHQDAVSTAFGDEDLRRT